MAKEKRSIGELKVESFLTTLDADKMNMVRGGAMLIRGRQYTYRTRWTLVDTRSDATVEASVSLNPTHQKPL